MFSLALNEMMSEAILKSSLIPFQSSEAITCEQKNLNFLNGFKNICLETCTIYKS
jgi:hypothetical protein